MQREPRIVTPEDIDAFEKQYPLYRGIGDLMIQRGIWILAETAGRIEERSNGSPDQPFSRHVCPVASGTLHAGSIKVSQQGACR